MEVQIAKTGSTMAPGILMPQAQSVFQPAEKSSFTPAAVMQSVVSEAPQATAASLTLTALRQPLGGSDQLIVAGSLALRAAEAANLKGSIEACLEDQLTGLESYTAYSDESGRFVFHAVQAGCDYRLSLTIAPRLAAGLALPQRIELYCPLELLDSFTGELLLIASFAADDSGQSRAQRIDLRQSGLDGEESFWRRYRAYGGECIVEETALPRPALSWAGRLSPARRSAMQSRIAALASQSRRLREARAS